MGGKAVLLIDGRRGDCEMEKEVAALVEALKRALREAMPEVPIVELRKLNYNEAISGEIPEIHTWHGIRIPLEDDELFELVNRGVQELYDADWGELYLTVEKGLILQVVADITNNYGRSIGTEYFFVPFIDFLEKLKRRSKKFSSEALKEVALKTIQSLEKFLE